MSAPRSTPHAVSAFHRSVTHHATVVHHAATYRRSVSRHATTRATSGPAVRETTHARIDINSYHKNVTAERRFHYGEYRAPPGYAYRRWTYGERLPQEYYAQDYWIPNYLNFGLPWTPDGCEWVRYGPDALLIDVDSGEIVQVEYGVFY
jgi:Ni/Co efflux regulator RcnB